MLRSLPRIAQPNGAIAVVNQSSTSQLTPPPRGMTLDNRHTQKRTRLIPSGMASLQTQHLWRAYMATRTVVACEEARELKPLLETENRELVDAAKKVVPSDASLEPRAVAITLLVHGTTASMCAPGRVYLDGLAHLASSPMAPQLGNDRLTASIARMTVLAGPDAAWFVDNVKGEVLNTVPETRDGTVQLCVRWAVEESIRSEFKVMEIGVTADRALELIQNYLISIKMAYNVSIPDDITTRHPNVPADAWAHSVHNASKAFFMLMEGGQIVQKGAFLEAFPDTNVENVGVYVRICSRVTYMHSTQQWIPIPFEDATRRSDCFHGFLVGNPAYSRLIQSFCKRFEQTGLPLPDTEETRAFCLHTAAVQATGFPLERRVSLYAVSSASGGHKPGTPISSPGSWMWRLDPAIMPLEVVLQNFHVVPCNRDSLLPGDRRLETAFGIFFNRAFKLYTTVFGNATADKSGDEFERLPLTIPARPSDSDPEREAEERYILTAFGLDASSNRVVVGDAYAALKAKGAPEPLTNFMLQSTLSMGLNTSVVDAFQVAARILANKSQSPTTVDVMTSEMGRLKRVADSVLELEAKRHKDLPSAMTIDSTKVQSLLRAAGLRMGEDVRLPKAGSSSAQEYSMVVQALSTAILSAPASEKGHAQACYALCEGHKKNALNGLCAAISVLRAEPKVMMHSVFVVTQVEGEEGKVGFNRVEPNGSFEKTSPGSIVDSPKCSVVLVKFTKNQATRVTALVRA